MIIDYLLEHNRYMNVLGIGVILGIAFFFSKKRSAINYRLVGTGLLLQMLIGFFALQTTVGRIVIAHIAYFVGKLYEFADQGSGFVFGALASNSGSLGTIFAVKVLPVIIFFGALMSLLFYLGVIQRIVWAMSIVIRPLLGTSGSETLCAVANSFLGQTEAPLLVRHYLKDMTKSEMMLVMISGMATISGSILVVFGKMGVPVEHLLASSVMAIPASILIAKILYPETEKSKTAVGADVSCQSDASNVFDAISAGTIDGLHLAVNVAAMLIAFLSLLALVDFILGFGASPDAFAAYEHAELTALRQALGLPPS